ncbi:MAG: hypothetical protein CL912_18285 [Deltaproteobacteria bacterium]|nr:hypothetical protein [Deltaproteobacteria bacterium]
MRAVSSFLDQLPIILIARPANSLGIFAPVVTLVLSAIVVMYKYHKGLDVETIFTTTALLSMVTHPANMVMTIIPRAVASLANFERVQTYLLVSPRSDQRQVFPGGSTNQAIGGQARAVLLQNVTIQPDSKMTPILQDVDLEIGRGAIVMCSGRVGTGKTMLVGAILGEVSPSRGTVSMFTKRVGLCTQVPWLPSGTIKDVIRGSSPNRDDDDRWYEIIVDTCGLRNDFENMSEGDSTQVGSRGLNLSGGQRQRLVSFEPFRSVHVQALTIVKRLLLVLSTHDLILSFLMTRSVPLMERPKAML